MRYKRLPSSGNPESVKIILMTFLQVFVWWPVVFQTTVTGKTSPRGELRLLVLSGWIVEITCFAQK